MIRFMALRAKIYTYLTDDNDEKKKKIQKSASSKNLKFKDQKQRLKATQFEHKINLLGKKQN